MIIPIFTLQQFVSKEVLQYRYEHTGTKTNTVVMSNNCVIRNMSIYFRVLYKHHPGTRVRPLHYDSVQGKKLKRETKIDVVKRIISYLFINMDWRRYSSFIRW